MACGDKRGEHDGCRGVFGASIPMSFRSFRYLGLISGFVNAKGMRMKIVSDGCSKTERCNGILFKSIQLQSQFFTKTCKDKKTTALEMVNSLVSFDGYEGYACRSKNGGQGKEGEEYARYSSVTHAWCKTECTNDGECQGYEYHDKKMVCEIWHVFYHVYESKEGLHCYYKTF